MISNHIGMLFVLFLFILSTTFILLIGNMLALHICNIKIDKIHIFVGKEIKKLTYKNIPISINILPIGNSISYDVEGYKRLNVLLKLFILLSGPLLLFFSSTIFISYDEAINGLLRGFLQLIQGSLSPFTIGSDLIHKLFLIISKDGGYLTAYGLFATKMVAFQLLPIPSFNGWNVICEILLFKTNIRTSVSLQIIGVVITILLLVSWFLSLCYSVIV